MRIRDRTEKAGSAAVEALLAFALLAGAPAAFAERFSFIAWGDTPYAIPADIPRFERQIERINAEKPAFSVHVGDIKSGSTPCTDAGLERILDYFRGSFEQPLVYTPGDNEWTDCHRRGAGAVDPIARLAKVRELFFARPTESFGRTKLRLETQAADPQFARFVENLRWARSGVHFATVHVVGSSNNLQRDRAAVEEYLERNAANLAWIRGAFAQARAQGALGMVFFFQGDPEFELWDDRRPGYVDTLETLRTESQRFDNRPVLLVHGDSHVFRVDRPLKDSRDQPIQNVTRLEVFGFPHHHLVRVDVDTESPDLFSFAPLLIRENLLRTE